MSDAERRILIDTNVWISAFLYRNGPDNYLVEKVIKDRYTVVINHQIIEEFNRVMTTKFQIDQKAVDEAIHKILAISTVHEPMSHFVEELDDPSDEILIDTALDFGCSIFITGDKYLRS